MKEGVLSYVRMECFCLVGMPGFLSFFLFVCFFFELSLIWICISSRLVTAASGAASGRFLNYEGGGPEICVQTAYGIEVNVSFCSSLWWKERCIWSCVMHRQKVCFLFWWPKLASRLFQVECCPYDPRSMVFMDYRDYDDNPEEGPPSFLYVMPMSSTQVFFEVIFLWMLLWWTLKTTFSFICIILSMFFLHTGDMFGSKALIALWKIERQAL